MRMADGGKVPEELSLRKYFQTRVQEFAGKRAQVLKEIEGAGVSEQLRGKWRLDVIKGQMMSPKIRAYEMAARRAGELDPKAVEQLLKSGAPDLEIFSKLSNMLFAEAFSSDNGGLERDKEFGQDDCLSYVQLKTESLFEKHPQLRGILKPDVLGRISQAGLKAPLPNTAKGEIMLSLQQSAMTWLAHYVAE